MSDQCDEMPAALAPRPPGYTEWLAELKARVQAAQQRAALSVNRELLTLYWQLGRDVLERQAREGWGAGIIDQVSADLRAAFPEIKGFSRSNLKYMRAFAEAWPDLEIGQPPVGQLPWAHHLVLLTKLKTSEERVAHAQQALARGWSRNVLALHIERARIASSQQDSPLTPPASSGHKPCDADSRRGEPPAGTVPAMWRQVQGRPAGRAERARAAGSNPQRQAGRAHARPAAPDRMLPGGCQRYGPAPGAEARHLPPLLQSHPSGASGYGLPVLWIAESPTRGHLRS